MSKTGSAKKQRKVYEVIAARLVAGSDEGGWELYTIVAPDAQAAIAQVAKGLRKNEYVEEIKLVRRLDD